MARNSFQKSLKNNGSLKVEATLVNSQDFGNGKELKVIEFSRAVHWGNCQNVSKGWIDPENENLRNPCKADCYEGKVRVSLVDDINYARFTVFVEETSSIDGEFSLKDDFHFEDWDEGYEGFEQKVGQLIVESLYR